MVESLPWRQAAELLPWQQVTVGCGLMLAAASDIRLDGDELRRQALDAIARTPAEGRHHYGSSDGSWTSIPLLRRGDGGRYITQPALAHLPLLTGLLDRARWEVRNAYILHQAPGSLLPWHFDNQALHLEEARLLLAAQVPAAAFTWIGHEKLAFPQGTLWTGDFALPHQVENPDGESRLVIAIDVTSNDAARASFPPALYEQSARRQFLAGEAVSALRRVWTR